VGKSFKEIGDKVMFDCCSSADECKCECHKNKSIMHFSSCCERCPVCERNIESNYNKHVSRCIQELKRYRTKTDLDFVKSMLYTANLGKKEHDKMNQIIAIDDVKKEITIKVERGYSGFYTYFIFNMEGSLLEMGASEG
jgi:hypothetical protein